MMIAIVGNRTGFSYEFVKNTLTKLGVCQDHTLVSGGCPQGVDNHAERFAKEHGMSILIHYPDNKKPSPQRYFDRNKDIAESCDLLIAFDKGSSEGSGTLNTINHAKKLKKKIKIFKEENYDSIEE